MFGQGRKASWVASGSFSTLLVKEPFWSVGTTGSVQRAPPLLYLSLRFMNPGGAPFSLSLLSSSSPRYRTLSRVGSLGLFYLPRIRYCLCSLQWQRAGYSPFKLRLRRQAKTVEVIAARRNDEGDCFFVLTEAPPPSLSPSPPLLSWWVLVRSGFHSPLFISISVSVSKSVPATDNFLKMQRELNLVWDGLCLGGGLLSDTFPLLPNCIGEDSAWRTWGRWTKRERKRDGVYLPGNLWRPLPHASLIPRRLAELHTWFSSLPWVENLPRKKRHKKQGAQRNTQEEREGKAKGEGNREGEGGT